MKFFKLAFVGHDPNISVASQGNLQSLPNGNKFIGWGQSPYYSEYNEAGNTKGNPALNLLYAAQIPSTNYSYRAYRHDWTGKPFYPPSIGIISSSGKVIGESKIVKLGSSKK